MNILNWLLAEHRARRLVSGITSYYQKETLRVNGYIVQRGLSGLYWKIYRSRRGVDLYWLSKAFYAKQERLDSAYHLNGEFPLSFLDYVLSLCILPRRGVNAYDHIYTIARLVQSAGGERYLLHEGNITNVSGTGLERSTVMRFLGEIKGLGFAYSMIVSSSIAWKPIVFRAYDVIGVERTDQLIDTLAPNTPLWDHIRSERGKLAMIPNLKGKIGR